MTANVNDVDDEQKGETQKLNMIGEFVKRNSQKNGNKIKKISRVFYGTGKVSYDTNCVWNFEKLKKISTKSARRHKIERREEK